MAHECDRHGNGRLAVCLLAFLALAGCRTAPGYDEPGRMNVILMMADDLASNDLSCYGGARIKTPRIDALAGESLRLTSYYAGSSVCTPSRMALLSGAYPARLGWRWGVLGYGFPNDTGMSSAVYTMAEAFRDAGYRTAMTGKWHLGDGRMQPREQGFESSYYIRMSNNQNRDMYRDGELVQKKWDNRLLTEAFAAEAVRVIREDRDKPFFLYVPWSAPHFPAEPHPEWLGRSGKDKSGKYTDVVAELDMRVGQILDALRHAGKADETIVIFTSDNGRQGGQEAQPADPLYSGQKWQSREGGTRVPCILRVPGQRPAVSDAIVSAMDLFPTLAAACDVSIELPEGAQEMDGRNLAALVGGDATAAEQRTELLYWHGKGPATAIRVGNWKLHFHACEQQPKDRALVDGPALYDLSRDVMERDDVAAAHPDRVRSMIVRARELLTDVYAKQVPLGLLPGGVHPDPLEPGDVWGPALGR